MVGYFAAGFADDRNEVAGRDVQVDGAQGGEWTSVLEEDLGDRLEADEVDRLLGSGDGVQVLMNGLECKRRKGLADTGHEVGRCPAAGEHMAKKAVKPPDRRVQRTRKLLREALIGLILERGWEGCSVQDVCDRADVGRSTFYTHYADKEDLLTGGLGDLHTWIRAEFAREGMPLSFAQGLIEHAYEQKRLFRAMVGKGSGVMVQRKFREVVAELVRADMGGTGDDGRRDAAVHFLTGGLLEMVTWWLESRNPLPPEEINKMFLQFSEPVASEFCRTRR